MDKIGNVDSKEKLVFPERLKQPAAYTTVIGKQFIQAKLRILKTRGGEINVKAFKIKEAVVSWAAIVRPEKWGFDIVVIPLQVTLKLKVQGWIIKADKFGIKEAPTYTDKDYYFAMDSSISEMVVDANKFDPLGEGIAPKEVEVKQFETGPIKINIKF